MALTVTSRGSGGNTTGATSIGVVPASNFAAGSLAVLVIAYDNTGTNGADPYSSISDGTNTWTSRQNVLNDPGAANAGVAGRFFTAPVSSLTTGSTITVNFGAFSVPAKAWQLLEVSGSSGTPTFKTAGAAGGQIPASNTAPSLTTGSITNGSALFAAWFREGNATPSASDSDTTNGNWSSLWGTGQGSAATGIEVRGQHKIVSATATQTFDHTYAAGRDTVGGWIEVEEVVSGGATVTPTTLAATTATFAPTIAHRINGASPTALTLSTFAPVIRLQVTPTTASLSSSAFAPTVTATANQSVTPSTAPLTSSTFAPTVTASDHKSVTPTTATLSTTGFAPTIGVSDNKSVTPTTASLSTAGFAPTIGLSDHQLVTPATAELALEAQDPTVTATAHQWATPDLAELATETFAPTVTATDHQVAVPSPASLSLTAYIPDVEAIDPKLVTPDVASLTLEGYEPGIYAGTTVFTEVAALTLATFAPTVALTDNQLVTPEAAALALSSFLPVIEVGGPTLVVPEPATLQLTTFAPNLGTVVDPNVIRVSIAAGSSMSGSVSGNRMHVSITPGSGPRGEVAQD